MKQRVFLLASMLAASFCVAPSARSWGCKGHQTVALIAAKHVTGDGRRLVEKLLGENPIDPKLKRYCGNATNDLLVDASTWPDDVRSERHNGPWHYLDIPRGKHKGSLEAYCGTDGCVTGAIEEQRAILKDKAADPVNRAEAIRYLIHFVGDMHQPLHVINNGDNGGNCVAVKYLHHEPLPSPQHPEREDYSPNLHQIWDTEIVERDMEVSNPHRYADELDEKFPPRERRLGSGGHSCRELGVGGSRACGNGGLRCVFRQDPGRTGRETERLLGQQPPRKTPLRKASGGG